MRTQHSLLLPVLLFLISISLPLDAQQPTGSITGIVRDATGAVIPGAGISLSRQATGISLQQTTSEAGMYSFSSLLPGTYQIKVEASGFKTAILDLLVEVGRVTAGDLRLEVGSPSETVNVEAHAVAVSPTRTGLEGIITENLIRDLPLNGRNFLDLGQLEPGVQMQDGGNVDTSKGGFAGLSAGGQLGRTTRITVDGLDVSDETVGTTTQNISQDAIQEYQISRSNLDMSTGLTASGAVNVVTKSGNNELHGSGYIFARTADFAARIGQDPMPFDREQCGFNAGGPFLKDRLYWFVNYEQNNQDGAVATQIGGFPQFSGAWPLPFDERMAMGRADWNLTRDSRLFFRFTHNFNDGIGGGPSNLGGTTLSPFSTRNYANQTALGFDAVTGRVSHSFRFGYLNFRDYFLDARDRIPGLPQTVDPAGRPLLVAFGFGGWAFSGSPQIGPSYWAPQSTLQHNHEFRYDGSLPFGRHSLRWGILVNLIRVVGYFNLVGNAPEIDITFNPDNQGICGDNVLCYPVSTVMMGNGLGWSTEIPALGFPYGGAKNTRFHVYLGDSWRLSQRITLNLGLRYVYEPGADNPDLVKPALLDSFLPGLSRSNRRDKNNFAPQMGVAWDPTGSGKWLIRAGAGLFYDLNVFGNKLYERGESLPPGISNTWTPLPWQRVIDPNNGNVIFNLTGASPDATVTPGVNWVSGCSDPRFPGGPCPLGTPGLIDAVFSAWKAYTDAYQVASAGFPSGPTQFEITQGLQYTFDPNYKTPYSMHLNFGLQHELRPGLVLSVDYLRNLGLHSVMRRDFNRVGAADTLNIANARTAIDATHGTLGCPAGPAGVNCAIAAGANIEVYAANGLGRGEAASPSDPSPLAFPGFNPQFNAMNLNGMQGRSTYNALQVALRGRLPDLGGVIKNWNIVASYSLGRLTGIVDDQAYITILSAVNNDDLLGFSGPCALDRTHIVSVGSVFQIPGGIHLNSIWRFNSALPQSAFVPQVSGSAAEIFYTDFNGDGTYGDPLPGTRRGSFGRDIGNASALNRAIDSYNATQAGQLTPAGKALANAGLFTEAQLKALGAVSPQAVRTPEAQVNLDSFITTDVRITRPFHLRGERITIEPALEIFNLFNVANYDLPGNKLGATLTGATGSINGTTAADRPNRAGFGSGSFALGIPRAWQIALRVSF
jgi:hypothetical protein